MQPPKVKPTKAKPKGAIILPSEKAPMGVNSNAVKNVVVMSVACRLNQIGNLFVKRQTHQPRYAGIKRPITKKTTINMSVFTVSILSCRLI